MSDRQLTFFLGLGLALCLGLTSSGCSDSDDPGGPRINTVAGDGGEGYAGDGSDATLARLHHPQDVAVDADGVVYIADTDNHRIRRVDAGGLISTVAGDGSAGFGGDGGPATSAQLFHPQGLALDGSGNLYIADTENNRVRRVDRGGTITTVAGTGEPGFGGDGGPADVALVFHPTGVDVDPRSGDLLVADSRNQRIRRVSGGTITTLAGDGTPGYGGDGGLATSASLRLASNYFRMGDVAADFDGNVFVADSGNHVVRKIDPSGVISTVAGRGTYSRGGDGGLALQAGMAFPAGLAVLPSGAVLVCDTANQDLRQFNDGGVIRHVAGLGLPDFSGDGGVASSAGLRVPMGLAVSEDLEILVADVENGRVRRIAP